MNVYIVVKTLLSYQSEADTLLGTNDSVFIALHCPNVVPYTRINEIPGQILIMFIGWCGKRATTMGIKQEKATLEGAVLAGVTPIRCRVEGGQ